jgi:hypothetical protein
VSGLWIRVNARLADDPDVRAFARVLFPTTPLWIAVAAACGLLVTLWGRVVDEQEDGNVADRDDDVLEEWAKWRGKAGAFATAFRSAFTHDDGLIRGWREYQGPLVARREKDRARKSARTSRGTPRGVRAESPPIPQEIRTGSSRNGDGDGNGESSSSSSSVAPSGFDAVAELLATVPAESRAAWSAEIAVAREGMHGPPLSDEQIQTACRDFVGNGGMAAPSLRHFRGYLRNPTPPKSPRATGDSNPFLTPTMRALAAEQDARERV